MTKVKEITDYHYYTFWELIYYYGVDNLEMIASSTPFITLYVGTYIPIGN